MENPLKIVPKERNIRSKSGVLSQCPLRVITQVNLRHSGNTAVHVSSDQCTISLAPKKLLFVQHHFRIFVAELNESRDDFQGQEKQGLGSMAHLNSAIFGSKIKQMAQKICWKLQIWSTFPCKFQHGKKMLKLGAFQCYF